MAHTPRTSFAIDLVGAHRQALEIVSGDGERIALSFARQQARMWRRHLNELEFHHEAQSHLRRSATVELMAKDGDDGAALAKNLARAAMRGVPSVHAAAGKGRSYELTKDGVDQLTRVATQLGLSKAALKRLNAAVAPILPSPSQRKENPLPVGVALDFKFDGKEIGRLPIDVMLARDAADPPILARYSHRADWLTAIGALPEGDAPLSFRLDLPTATLSHWVRTGQSRSGQIRGRYSRWALTPNASWSDDVLLYLQEARFLGYPVICKILGANTGEIEFPVDHVALRFQGKRHGLYSPRDFKLDSGELVGETEDSSAPLIEKYRVNADLYWSERVTHLLAPTADAAIKRYAYSIPDSALPSIFADIAADGLCAKAPLIEAKTPIYRYFADVDLPWKTLEACPAFADLKKAQLGYFGGDANENYAGLGRLVGAMHPATGSQAASGLISRRVGASADKDGHHIVFPEVLIANDGRQGLVLTGQLEWAAARAIGRNPAEGLGRFLVGVLLNDQSHLDVAGSPLSFHVRREAIVKAGFARDASELAEMCVHGITLRLADGSVALDDGDAAELMRFALTSMGQPALTQHFNWIVSAPSLTARTRALFRLAGRCRWEVLRRARFFDHSVYSATMGLRLIGTRKFEDDESCYLPANQEGRLQAETIAGHSIRSSKTTPTSPSLVYGELLRALSRKRQRCAFQVHSLDGLLTLARERKHETLTNLKLEIRILPRRDRKQKEKIAIVAAAGGDGKSAKTESIQIDRSLSLKGRSVLRPGASLPYFARYQELDHPEKGLLYLWPPRRRRRPRFKKAGRSFTDAQTIRVRVYIPSPVAGFGVGLDLGGDNRDASLDAGSSRLQVDVTLDRASGAMQWSAAWGESSEYSPDDTVSVPGKPDWWRDKRPGAEPLARATLPLTPDNVKVSASRGSTGATVEVSYSGAVPLIPAPSIDGAFTIVFHDDGSLSVHAAHDGFPAHTLFVNGNLVYAYDPATAGAGPTALFGDSDVVQDIVIPRTPPRRPVRVGPYELVIDPDNLWPDIPDGGDLSDDDAGDDAGEGDDDSGDPSSAGSGQPGGDTSGPPAASGDSAQDGGGQSIEIPLTVDQTSSASVTISFNSDSGPCSEDFNYSANAGGWVGDGGSFIAGGPEMFNETSGWSVTITVDKDGDHISLCFGGQCDEVTLKELYHD